MLYSDTDILKAIAHGKIDISPYNELAVQPNSYDVVLGEELRIFTPLPNEFVDIRSSLPRTMPVKIPNEGYPLYPGQFLLAHTEEVITLSEGVAARIEGRSSLGRIGLSIHTTAGWIDAGFCGQITLELKNELAIPIVLYPGMAIGQVCFYETLSPSKRPYGSRGLGSHYQNQVGAEPSRIQE